MTTLEKLIEELCPDGVEYRALGEVAQVGTGSSNGNEATEDGEFPFFIRSQTIKYKNEYEYDEEAIIIPGEGGVGEIFHYINGKYAIHQRVYRIHIEDELINTCFIYYYMKSNFKKFILKKAVSATVTSIRKPMIEKFQIPIPPIAVQREIVRILDKFTQITAELTAELTARKKQYEYYRDSLLSFGDEAAWKTLGEVAKISNGKDHKHLGEGSIPVYGSGGIMRYVNQFIYDKTSVLIPRKGSIGNIYYMETPFWTVDTIFYTKINFEFINARFLYYYLLTQNIEKLNTAGGVPSLTKTVLDKIKIPIPPLAEQRRIVDILGRFDTLCNDISKGLPAEIQARKKQYEYYRDKLLSFKKLDEEA